MNVPPALGDLLANHTRLSVVWDDDLDITYDWTTP